MNDFFVWRTTKTEKYFNPGKCRAKRTVLYGGGEGENAGGHHNNTRGKLESNQSRRSAYRRGRPFKPRRTRNDSRSVPRTVRFIHNVFRVSHTSFVPFACKTRPARKRAVPVGQTIITTAPRVRPTPSRSPWAGRTLNRNDEKWKKKKNPSRDVDDKRAGGPWVH